MRFPKNSLLLSALLTAAMAFPSLTQAQTDTLLYPLITDMPNRTTTTLDGSWHYIIDPFETGYLDYRHHANAGFFENRHASNPSDLVEYDFATSPTMHIPGDWNTQDPHLLYYEGSVWFERDFVYHKKPGDRVFLHFGAANYDAVVGLNGRILGEHEGGFTPFDFEVTDALKEGDNFIVVRVNNQRHLDGIPTDNFDWWNYGGITRSVSLLETPPCFVRDYGIRLTDLSRRMVTGWVQLDGALGPRTVTLAIPQLGLRIPVHTGPSGRGAFCFRAPGMELWSPQHPKRYDLLLENASDTLRDQVGFRTVAVSGDNILLNGKPIFLRGVSIHEEAPFGGGRSHNVAQDHILLSWAKQLGCNYVRLAHYPHNEAMIREAERMGILVWSEIPVYWTIQWTNPGTLDNAKRQLTEEITRDRNRANIILWSVGNETPRTAPRLLFMQALVRKARELDSSRLITAALQLSGTRDPHTYLLDDPLGASLDVLGCNIYPGWYGPSADPKAVWETPYHKPMIMSEIGAGALQGLHGPDTQRWTEEFQNRVYREDIALLRRIPFLRGMTPWVLKDFRSPKRLLPDIQDSWNRKGLISDQGIKKEAFYTLRNFYRAIAEGRIRFDR